MSTTASRLGLLSLLTTALIACSSDDDTTPNDNPVAIVDDTLSIAPDATSVALRDERSLVITNPAALAATEKRFSFGKLMEKQGAAAATEGGMGLVGNDKVPAKDSVSDYTPNEWVDHVFSTAAKELDDHSKASAKARLGIVPVENPLAKLRQLWSGKNGTLDSTKKGVSLGDGPFRLLAVVNRLDLAGDVDSRDCCTGAAKIARPFGEGRLVFGLVDPTMEGRANPKAYPMTIIIEFRLPALNDKLAMAADDFDYKGALTNDGVWRSQMERWGQIWQEQSRFAPNTQEFQTRLASIIARFAQPQNFLSIRSGFQVEDTKGNIEFEYREWYVLQGSTHLIPRKPRREPYRCGSKGKTLTDIIERQWADDQNDLEMRGINPAGKSISYDIPRDDGRGLAKHDGPMEGCPTDDKGKGIPFEMDGQQPNSDEPRAIINAPFARFGKSDVWTLEGQTGNGAKREDERHAFAIRTCSGCHGKEAGLFGFQISPRLKNEESKLADFMTGKGGNQFSHGGADYHYDDLAARRAFATKAAKRDETLAVYSGLWRHDRR